MAQTDSYASMPGAFTPPAEYPSGAKSNVFRPPNTPSASSSMLLDRSTISILTDGSERSIATSRKRTRQDYSDNISTPQSTPLWSSRMDTGDFMVQSAGLDASSPMPFVSTRYQLAGGLDTPTGAAAARFGEDSEFSDVNYRRTLNETGTKRMHEQSPSYTQFPRLAEPEMESSPNGMKGVPSLTQQSSSGLKLALDVVGGVVGKVWEFCKAGAFRGFTAGAGTKYDFGSTVPYPSIERDTWQVEAEEKIMMNDVGNDGTSTPLPGRFPDEDFIEDYMDRAYSEDTPPRASKRRQINNNDGALGKNWVVVPNPTTIPATARPSPRPVSRYNMPTTSSANRRTTAVPNRPASRASGRRPGLAASRPSGVSHAGSPALRQSRPASFASPRSPGGSKIPVPSHSNSPSKSVIPSSPAAIEAQKWAAKKKREERETDESIRRFNAQLKAMIREGKQALGTKVEVEGEIELGDDVDEGFQDGDFEGIGKKGW